MTGQVPSYLVRNLVEAALGRTDTKPTRKARRSNKTLCLAIPTKSFRKHDESLGEVKALFKLYERYENEAERTLYNGVAKTNEKDGGNLNSDKLTAVGTAVQAKPKNRYLKEIHSKLSLPPSPELPALSSGEQATKELTYYPEKRSNSTNSRQNRANGLILPALTDKPFCSGDNSSNEDTLKRNSKVKELENFERNSFENLNLEESLTVVPLNRTNFAHYDSLATFYGVGPNSSPRSPVESSRNSESPVGILVSVPESRSEDGCYVNFEDYLREISDGESEASLEEGGCELNQPKGTGEFTEPSLALVEYKAKYRNNVHFSENLHEVHLYSPVQNHWRRRRRRRRHTDDDT